MNDPLISILCITYNQEKYIREALDGFLAQKTEYTYEIVIHDDCSTDGTKNILLEYQKNYPNIIKLILQKKNQYSIGNNIIKIAQDSCAGKYIAICEGDDYWVDKNKIQSQCDFLEKNIEYSMTFHNSFIRQNTNPNLSSVFCNFEDRTFSINDVILNDWFIPTQSMMYRRSAMIFQPWFSFAHSIDYSMQLILSLSGKFNYINKPMSVYRVHKSGVSARNSPGFSQMKKIQILSHFNLQTNFVYRNLIDRRLEIEKKLIFRAFVDTRPLPIRLLSIDFYLNKIRNRIPLSRKLLGN